MDPLRRVIQTGIGLAAEIKAASKERKASVTTVEEISNSERGNAFPLVKHCLRYEPASSEGSFN